jgi:AraC-like DNA-binding protein
MSSTVPTRGDAVDAAAGRREPTVAVQVLHALVGRAAELGLPREPLIARTGVSADTLADIDGRVPARIVRRLWEELPVACEDPWFGLNLAARVPDAALGIVTYVAQHAATLGQGFTAAVRYARLLQDVAACFVEPIGDAALGTEGDTVARGLRFVQAPPPRGLAPPRHAVEFAFARAILMARRSTGVDVTPSCVRFAFPRPVPPSAADPYGPLFGERLVFDHPRNELDLDGATLALPQRAADPWLRELVEAHARDLLGRVGARGTFADDVARALGLAIQRGQGDLSSVAGALGLSARTLQRRLGHEGLTFRRLADEARHALAVRYLADERQSLSQIALMLGFSEQAAFQRAFVRWTGTTPGQLRRRAVHASRVA